MLKEFIFKIRVIKKAFQIQNSLELKKVSNRLIEEAAIKNDSLIAELSSITYALYKVTTKAHYVHNPKWKKVRSKILELMDRSIVDLKKKDVKSFENNIHKIITDIEQIDKKIGNFAMSLYSKGQVKQASRAYSTGLSLSQAAFLTGCNKKKLQEYIGSTTLHDEMKVTLGIKSRLSMLKEALREIE